jgi:hypothetical protein
VSSSRFIVCHPHRANARICNGSYPDAILARLRERGYTTVYDWAKPSYRPRRANFTLIDSWVESAAWQALTKTELQIDAIIGAVAPNEEGLRLITVRDIQSRVANHSAVVAGLRVLTAVGRWTVTKVQFIAPDGRLRWKNGYQEGDWLLRFIPWGDTPEELQDMRRDMVLEAKEVAREQRNYRMQTTSFLTLGLDVCLDSIHST